MINNFLEKLFNMLTILLLIYHREYAGGYAACGGWGAAVVGMG